MIRDLKRAISIAGGQTRLAEKITELLPEKEEIGQTHIWTWLNRDKKVPAEYCKFIEKITNGEVKRESLRPDVFGEA